VVLERMPAGVATRRHTRAGEPVGPPVDGQAAATSNFGDLAPIRGLHPHCPGELLSLTLSILDVNVTLVCCRIPAPG
jgi:hypothetical protein